MTKALAILLVLASCKLPHRSSASGSRPPPEPPRGTPVATLQGFYALVVAATVPPTDCAQLASEIAAAHAGQIFRWGNTTQLVVVERRGMQIRQRLFVHSLQGKLAESFSWIIDDAADPSVKRGMSIGHEGDELFTEKGPYHWDAEARRYIPGQKMSRSTRKSF